MSFEIIWENGNPHVTFEGDISFSIIRNADERIIGDNRFDNIRYMLFNFNNVSSINIKPDEISTLVALDKSALSWNKTLKLLIVAKDGDLNEILQDYLIKMEDVSWDVKHFESLDEAKNGITNQYKTTVYNNKYRSFGR